MDFSNNSSSRLNVPDYFPFILIDEIFHPWHPLVLLDSGRSRDCFNFELIK